MPESTDSDLLDVARAVAYEARGYLTTVTEVAAGTIHETSIPLLLLAVSDVLAAGARLGAMVDVVPVERFEPDAGPDPDRDPLRVNLANVLEGIDEYAEVVDPLVDPRPSSAYLSADLATIASALDQGLAHFDAGRELEALWWWQFSYLSSWGERASSALRVLQALLAHLRLDVPDEVAAEAEFEALHSDSPEL